MCSGGRSGPPIYQQPNQLDVRGRERQCTQFGWRGPLQRLSQLGRRLPDHRTAQEMQLDRPLWIGMHGREYFFTDRDGDVELFSEFARETAGKRFAGIALAAGKLPQPLEVDALLALGDQKAAVAFDDRGAHDDTIHDGFSGLNGNERQLLAIGQIRHRGVRATHTIAPKSISA